MESNENLIPCLFHVKYKGEVQLFKIPWTDLSFESFRSQFLKNFEVTVPAGSKLALRLTTNLGAPVSVNDFDIIIKTFHKGNFILNVEYESPFVNSNLQFVTPLMLRSYFDDKGSSHLLTKSKNLSDGQRKKIVNVIADFIFESFGSDPTHIQKLLTAPAAIVEFPGLEFTGGGTGDGTRLLLGENGWINRRLRYIKECQKHTESETVVNQVEVRDDEDAKLVMELLKKIVIRDSNMSDVKNKLNSTRNYRKHLMTIKETDVRHMFPFFMTNPELILFDYAEEFKLLCSYESFIKLWPSYGDELRQYCNVKYDCEKHSIWSDDIENVILLLKVFPLTGKGKKKPFKDNIEKLIVFRVIGTDPNNMICKSNIHPYIVAMGTSMTEITCYYVELEKHLIPLPTDWSIIQVLIFFINSTMF